MLTQDLKETLTLILAGGQGERLMPLTQRRAKPAVPFGGMYRIIDFTLSNCIHSGLRSIYVLTQYHARSLEEHIRFGWNFLPRRLGHFISVRPPHHLKSGKWYQGTADAIYHNIDTLESERPQHVLILSGDHIYKMDYGRMLAEHKEHGAALTIGAIPCRREEATRFGVFEVDRDDRVRSFQEKPAEPTEIPDRPGWSLASMGIYIFNTNVLIDALKKDAAREDSSHDFGQDIIPSMIGRDPVYVHHFTGLDGEHEPYWKDIGTIDSYYDANIDLCRVEPKFNLYEPDWPIYTFLHYEPPAKTVFGDPPGSGMRAEVVDSLLCQSVIVSGGRVKRSILSNRVRIDEHSSVDGAILFAGVRVGKGARIQRAIVDKWVDIPPGCEIGFDPEADARQFKVTPSGVVVVPHGYDFDQAPAPARAKSTVG
jgi:glucose-1-phosphate adenylyltransferase